MLRRLFLLVDVENERSLPSHRWRKQAPLVGHLIVLLAVVADPGYDHMPSAVNKRSASSCCWRAESVGMPTASDVAASSPSAAAVTSAKN